MDKTLKRYGIIRILIISSILILTLVGCKIQLIPSTLPSNSVKNKVSNSTQKPVCPKIEKTTIYDDIVTITANSFEYISSNNMYVVNIEINNNSDQTISYSLNGVNVNGFTLPSLTFGDIYAGMNTGVDVCFARSEVLLAEIESIQEIAFVLECKYSETDEHICSELATLKTSSYCEHTEEKNFAGVEAYNNEEYKIVIVPCNQPSVKHPANIYIENHTDQPLAVCYDNVALNNQMVITYMSGPHVLPNSRCIAKINIVYFNGEPDIDNITDMTLGFHILPYQSNGSFSTGDTIEVPAVTVDLVKQ